MYVISFSIIFCQQGQKLIKQIQRKKKQNSNSVYLKKKKKYRDRENKMKHQTK